MLNIIRISTRFPLCCRLFAACVSLLLAGILGSAVGLVSPVPSAAAATNLRLRVSPDRHTLETSDGSPFFWMGDTAWFLPKLSTTDIDLYLSDTAQKGFNGALIDVGYYYFEPVGEPPFLHNNPDTPNETYWQKVDWIVSRADAYGIYTALVVMWGNDYPRAFGNDTAKVRRFGKWLGQRYRDRDNVLWVVSGEYTAINEYRTSITAKQKLYFEQMAQGIRDGGGRQLMSIHPGSAVSSSTEFQNSPWLDFNLLQSGHVADLYAVGSPENHALVAQDYSLFPTRPVMDGEPAYEGHIDGSLRFEVFDVNKRIGEDTVRRKAYWAVFAGAFGHTYGHSGIEVFFRPGETYPYFSPVIWNGLIPWKQALAAPGRTDMRHLRSLAESEPLSGRVPDQTLLTSSPGNGIRHVQAIRDSGGDYAWIYIPTGDAVSINLAKLAGPGVEASWYNPRDGSSSRIGEFENDTDRTFDAPGATATGNDWVLVLESTTGSTATPGTATATPPAPPAVPVVQPPAVKPAGPPPPAISVLTVVSVTNFTAAIYWITDRRADGQVEFAPPCPSAGCLSQLKPNLNPGRTIQLSNLNAGTTYTYRARSRDAAGNLGVSPYKTFTTSGSASEPPPAVSAVSVVVTASTASISWTTDRRADGQVEFLSPCPSAGCMSSRLPGLNDSRTIRVSNLNSNTIYTYRVRSRDADGHLGVSSYQTFKTKGD